MIKLGGGWDELLSPLFNDERYKKIREFLKAEYSTRVIYPDMYDLYNCFRFTPIDKLKAVILGQDPYHEPNQAHGLCFSVREGVPLPPSLQNIYKEIESDLGIKEPNCGDLTKWAREGVLLLNTTLTVREHLANSHSKCGWAWFTEATPAARLRLSTVISTLFCSARTPRRYPHTTDFSAVNSFRKQTNI